jgi:hypothetical protein
MDAEDNRLLAALLRGSRIAALGTLRHGAPFVSMVPFVAPPDFTAFYIHISRLAQHTRDILQDARVSLMIAEADDGTRDPQTLARVSIQGRAAMLPPQEADHDAVRRLYLTRFPDGRFVAGFGRIFNLTREHFLQAAAQGA